METASNIVQRTEEWSIIRRGKFTASEIHKLMGKKFGENLSDWTETAQTYILSKVVEHFAEPMPEIQARPLAWGTEHESDAKAYYESLFKESIIDIGFVLWPENNTCGCSPDGTVEGKERGVEVKCPYTLESHIESFLIKSNADFKRLKTEYYWQVMSSMLFTGFKAWDFVSYHPNFNSKTKISCIEIIRDDKDIDTLKERLKLACQIRDNLIESITL